MTFGGRELPLYEPIHRLVHLKDKLKIKATLQALHLNHKQKGMINELRRQCNLQSIKDWNKRDFI
ncbi:hypothetical protein CFK40_15275 [Virgibacillus necropolis]|uniref:Uncharacterized protein n=1 Tax=Virgibacillus necropolis TaxID=163877 RepID=A0A221MF31_9BACI|nr:hypothetical protein CFK40_15275 [Virgibacillus necropolis]